jgi:PEP-CTERM motif
MMKIDRWVTTAGMTLLGWGITLGISANAAVININFNGLYTGLGAAPDASSNTLWNNLGLTAASNLLFSDGTTSSVGLLSSGFTSVFSNVPPANALLGTRLIKNDGDTTPASVTLSGLTPGARYDLYAYTGYYSTSFSVGTIAATATGTDFTENNPLNWLQGIQYAKLSAVSADTSGFLTLIVQGIDPNANPFTPTTVIAGLQIVSIDSTPVPEPTTPLALLGIGTLFFSLKRSASDVD